VPLLSLAIRSAENGSLVFEGSRFFRYLSRASASGVGDSGALFEPAPDVELAELFLMRKPAG
jgi:hypothetical protein